jgi:nitrate reductase cytochrome c-type subunit
MKWLSGVVYALASAALAQSPAPPSVPHPIDGYSVTRQENNCLECHNRPREIGKKQAKGLSPPLPASHYRKLEGKPEIADAHFVCTTCHKRK